MMAVFKVTLNVGIFWTITFGWSCSQLCKQKGDRHHFRVIKVRILRKFWLNFLKFRYAIDYTPNERAVHLFLIFEIWSIPILQITVLFNQFLHVLQKIKHTYIFNLKLYPCLQYNCSLTSRFKNTSITRQDTILFFIDQYTQSLLTLKGHATNKIHHSTEI